MGIGCLPPHTLVHVPTVDTDKVHKLMALLVSNRQEHQPLQLHKLRSAADALAQADLSRALRLEPSGREPIGFVSSMPKHGRVEHVRWAPELSPRSGLPPLTRTPHSLSRPPRLLLPTTAQQLVCTTPRSWIGAPSDSMRLKKKKISSGSPTPNAHWLTCGRVPPLLLHEALGQSHTRLRCQ